MTMEIDRIKFALLGAYAHAGSLDIGSWVERFPEHRNELLDFWLWARNRGHDRETESPMLRPNNHRRLAEEALQRACLAVSLGRQWFHPFVDEAEAQRVREGIHELRGRPDSATPTSRRAFRRAVVCVWVVKELSGVRGHVSRLAVQKTSYVLEEALALNLFREHAKQSLGPYDSTARYKDVEPIAQKKGWLRVIGSAFEVLENAVEIQQYAPRYLRSIGLARRLVSILGRLGDDELETWTTVHWIARKLPSRELQTTSVIREALKRDTTWFSKLDKPNFADPSIYEAVRGLRALGLLPE